MHTLYTWGKSRHQVMFVTSGHSYMLNCPRSPSIYPPSLQAPGLPWHTPKALYSNPYELLVFSRTPRTPRTARKPLVSPVGMQSWAQGRRQAGACEAWGGRGGRGE